MAFLKKYNGTYYIGYQEKVFFDPDLPPIIKIGANKGRVQKDALKAITEGRNYIRRSKWVNAKTSDRALAEKQLKQVEAKFTVEDAKQVNDLSFDEAVELAFPVLSSLSAYQTKEIYVLKELRTRWGSRYLGNITAYDLKGYIDDCEAQGLNPGTARRRLKLLRTIYREAFNSGRYQGSNPFDHFKSPKVSFKPRIVTLDDSDQRKLLKACWDPELLALYKRHKKKCHLLNALPADDLKRLGYDPANQARILEHLRYQTEPRSVEPETLHDLVLLTLAYGLRKGESLGVIKRGREGLQKVGGLRVRHYDPVTQRLYVIRTKQSKEDQASKKVTEIKVIPAIAAILEKHCQGKAPDDFIFCFKDKTPIMDIRWAFDEAVSFAGIRLKEVGSCGENIEMRLQFRDLRHVAANNLIESGLGMEEVAYYLGHSSTTMLQAVYYTRRKGSQLEQHAALVEKGMGRVLGERA